MNPLDHVSITELSRLTGKSRPTLYKYMDCFKRGAYDEIPYTFIRLFEEISDGTFSKEDMIAYCARYFANGATMVVADPQVRYLFEMILANRAKLDIDKIKTAIEKELKNGNGGTVSENPTVSTDL